MIPVNQWKEDKSAPEDIKTILHEKKIKSAFTIKDNKIYRRIGGNNQRVFYLSNQDIKDYFKENIKSENLSPKDKLRLINQTNKIIDLFFKLRRKVK